MGVNGSQKLSLLRINYKLRIINAYWKSIVVITMRSCAYKLASTYTIKDTDDNIVKFWAASKYSSWSISQVTRPST